MYTKPQRLTIKGTPLLKFQCHEKLEKLQKGYLYAKTLAYYRKLEEDTGDTTVGDRSEGMFRVHNGYVRLGDSDHYEKLDDALFYTKHSDDFVFCMFGVDPQTMAFSFSENQRTKMKGFGDSCMIILDSKEFVRRVCKAAEDKGFTAYYHKVFYYESDYDSGNMIVSLFEDPRNVAFWKRDLYEYQQEYRILFTPGNREVDHLDLDIGNITDISTIVPAESALNGLLEKRE